MNEVKIHLIKDNKEVILPKELANKLIKKAERENKTIQEILPEYKVVIT